MSKQVRPRTNDQNFVKAWVMLSKPQLKELVPVKVVEALKALKLLGLQCHLDHIEYCQDDVIRMQLCEGFLACYRECVTNTILERIFEVPSTSVRRSMKEPTAFPKNGIEFMHGFGDRKKHRSATTSHISPVAAQPPFRQEALSSPHLKHKQHQVRSGQRPPLRPQPHRPRLPPSQPFLPPSQLKAKKNAEKKAEKQAAAKEAKEVEKQAKKAAAKVEAKAKEKAQKERAVSKCGRCGKPKKGHVCLNPDPEKLSKKKSSKKKKAVAVAVADNVQPWKKKKSKKKAVDVAVADMGASGCASNATATLNASTQDARSNQGKKYNHYLPSQAPPIPLFSQHGIASNCIPFSPMIDLPLNGPHPSTASSIESFSKDDSIIDALVKEMSCLLVEEKACFDGDDAENLLEDLKNMGQEEQVVDIVDAEQSFEKREVKLPSNILQDDDAMK
ncbi:MAG: hypothetical protein SGARI_002213, partial [Bacillariaceae sp.]